jgi:hypothetical protein
MSGVYKLKMANKNPQWELGDRTANKGAGDYMMGG